MLLGIRMTAQLIIVGGLAVIALIVFQILIGTRKIKFKGPLHMRVHRWSAYAMLVLAAVHALAALAFIGVI